MMKCESITFDDLLDAEDNIDTHNPDIASHLETCADCQSRLSGLVASDEQWDETRHWLSMVDSKDAIVAESLEARDRWKRPIAWNDAMAKSLLSAASHPEMLGRIGRYDVERLIGSGGMGVVFKAYDTELNRPVAVKLLAPYLASSGAARSRFAREARAAAAVVDDHVVPIHNVETDGEHPFLVMKYIAGGSLQQRLDREGPLDVCEVLRIGMQTAKGLAAAHAQGLIHRDVKPSNILLDEGVDRALLTDFGLARATDDASLTRSGFHPGTPHYMSPEQVRGEAIDARSDLFGLGCVLYALCTGHPPFRSETSYAVLRRITDDTPRPIRETNTDVSEWLDAIVMKLLSKSRDDRFDSAEKVAELMEDCLAHVQNPTATPLPEPVAEIAKSFGSPDLTSASFGSFRYPPIGKLIAAAAFGFSLIFAGVLIVLELNKGTLTIESNVDDIPIRVMQGDEVVKELTVAQGSESTRISAGNYVVEVGGEFSGLLISDGGKVSLERSESVVVKITSKKAEKTLEKLNEMKPEGSDAEPMVGDLIMLSLTGDVAREYVKQTGTLPNGKDSENLTVETSAGIAQRLSDGRFRIEHHSSPQVIDNKSRITLLKATVDPSAIVRETTPPGTTISASPDADIKSTNAKETHSFRLKLSDLDNVTLKTFTESAPTGNAKAPAPAPRSAEPAPVELNKWSDRSPAAKALAELKTEHRELRARYNQASAAASDATQAKPTRVTVDPGESMLLKYLAFEQQHRGTDAGLQALVEVALLARMHGAGTGRSEASRRVLKHYLDHHGLETHATWFSSLYYLDSDGFLQTLVDKSPHRKTRAEALIAQLVQGDQLLTNESQLPKVLSKQKQSLAYEDDDPLADKIEILSALNKLENLDFKQLRFELNEKLKRLETDYSDVKVERYGTGKSAAERLSHAINRVTVGAEAPEMVATDINGQEFRLSKLRGNIVVVLFGENLGDDYGEMYGPLRSLVAKYSWAPVKFVGIMGNDDPAKLRAATKKGELNWTVIPEPQSGPLQLDWGITAYPTVYIVDANGVLQPELRMPYYGAGGNDTHELDDKLAEMLKPSPYGPSLADGEDDTPWATKPTPVQTPLPFDTVTDEDKQDPARTD